MNTDKQDKKVMDLFMDDSIWLKKITKEEKTVKEERKKEEKQEINPPEEAAITQEPVVHEKGFGEVDYAILKSITYGFKDIKQISKALQIRTVIVEKHIYALIKEGYLKYFQYAVITSKGNDAIIDFENNNPEDVWKPIDEFILAVIENKKERSLKMQKMIDLVLLIAMIILIILIIYFGLFS